MFSGSTGSNGTNLPKDLFDVPVIWILIRVLGMVFGLMYFYQVGPGSFLSDAIGGAVFIDIGVNSVATYIVACYLLPLLTDYGFMEFAGTLARPFFRKVFQLPGRAAIDAATSIVAASSIGLLVTISQFNGGNYSARQSCVIATNFSIVSIPFCLVTANVAGIGDYFVPWYGFVITACLVAAMITPRLPPLSRKQDVYIDGGTTSNHVDMTGDHSLVGEAWQRAMQRTAVAPGGQFIFPHWHNKRPVFPVLGPLRCDGPRVTRDAGYNFNAGLLLARIPTGRCDGMGTTP